MSLSFTYIQTVICVHSRTIHAKHRENAKLISADLMNIIKLGYVISSENTSYSV